MSDREDSPDWLRAFKAPAPSVLTLSSESESPLDDYPGSEDEIEKNVTGEKSLAIKNTNDESPIKKPSKKSTPTKKRKGNDLSKEGGKRDGKVARKNTSDDSVKPRESKHSVWALSSDSDSCPDTSSQREHNNNHEKSPALETDEFVKEEDKEIDTDDRKTLPDGASKLKFSKKRSKADDVKLTTTKRNGHMKKETEGDAEVEMEETKEKQVGSYVSSSRLPLVLAEKVQRTKALVECEGESIDLSGDVGSVGRVVITDGPSGNQEMFLDLKGTIYKTTIIPSRTFCVVSFGQSEAKVEAIMNDFIQLKPQSNVYESETLVEGTLEGFSFDSGDEADNVPNATTHQTDENEGGEPQANGKGKGKPGKASGSGSKKGKPAAKRPAKKLKKKPQVPKKIKAKK